MEEYVETSDDEDHNPTDEYHIPTEQAEAPQLTDSYTPRAQTDAVFGATETPEDAPPTNDLGPPPPDVLHDELEEDADPWRLGGVRPTVRPQTHATDASRPVEMFPASCSRPSHKHS